MHGQTSPPPSLLVWVVGVLALLVLPACGHASTSRRIQRLADQEASLRRSVEQLSARQRTLDAEIQRAEAQAARARCQASQDGYRAVVASIFSEQAAAVAQQKGCEAGAAKGGGAIMGVGCGLATLLSGGWALAFCGGAMVAGMVVSDSCDAPPPPVTEQEIQRIALQRTGFAALPRCEAADTTMAMAPHTRTVGVTWRPSARLAGEAAGDFFHVPTRKETRRARKAQRKQARFERKAAKAAEFKPVKKSKKQRHKHKKHGKKGRRGS